METPQNMDYPNRLLNEETPLHFHSSELNGQTSLNVVMDDDERRKINESAITVKTEHHESWRNILGDELAQMVRLALPVIGTYLFEMLPGVVSIVLVGHVHSEYTEQYMDATALAVMLLNLTGLSIGFGLASAMDTLCSQAYGADEIHRMGTYFQTGMIVLFITFCIVVVAMCYATDILIAFGQPVLVSEMAGTFARYLIPGIPFLYVYELIRKVLQAQNIALPMFFVAIVANLVNVVVGYYLVYYTSWGWLGAAIARTACNVSFLLTMIPYLCTSGLFSTFLTAWNITRAWKGLYEFIFLGIPGMFQLCFEWWAYEVLALLSGVLPNAVVAIGANSILLNIHIVLYMFYLGVSIAGNVRIGNALGAGLPKRASLAAYLTMGLGIIYAVLCVFILLVFSTPLPKLFTHDEGIDTYTSELLIVAAAFQIPDSVNAAVQGIFRGSGRQVVGAQLNFLGYYVVGIPLGAVLALKYGQDVLGLWVGITTGLCVVAFCGTVVTIKSDWDGLVDEARRRMVDEGKQL